MNALVWFLVIVFAIGLVSYLWPLFLFVVLLVLGYKIYEIVYFRGDQFAEIKDRIQHHIQDCNDLNQHIEDLKETSLVVNRTDYGAAEYHDKSRWNVKRTALRNQRYAPYVYDCSRTVCDNARKQPFKYICKYFGIRADEATLEQFETMLNNFSAVEDGKKALQAERETIMAGVSDDIPFLIKKLSTKKLEKELGFEPVDLSTLYFPKYVFRYVSSGGNTSTEYDVVMDIEN